jgi:hypothetical protein
MSPAAKKPSKAKDTAPKKSAEKEKGASEAWGILASLRRPFADRDSRWPVRRRVRNREEEPPSSTRSLRWYLHATQASNS